MKNWMWIALAIVGVVIVSSVLRQQRRRETERLVQEQYNQSNTTGTGLIAQISSLFGNNEEGTGDTGETIYTGGGSEQQQQAGTA